MPRGQHQPCSAFQRAAAAVFGSDVIPFSPALAGTLLYRGFTLWLPTVPGLLSAKKALDGGG